MIIIRKTNKLVSISLFLLILFSLSGIVLAESQTLFTDQTNDQRKISNDTLEDIVETLEDVEDGLTELYETLYEDWDNPKKSEQLTETESKRYNIGDMKDAEVKNLEDENATLEVTFSGNLEEEENLWILFLWSLCADEDELAFGFLVFGYSLEGMGGEDLSGVWFWSMIGDNDTYGEADFSDEGSTLEMEFPSELWDDDNECPIYAIMILGDSDNTDDVKYNYIDLYPGEEEYSLNYFDLILLIIFIVTYIALILIARQGGKGR